MLITFAGTHSTGKTTLLNKLKNHNLFKDYIFCDEITRSIFKKGNKINEHGDDNTQLSIMESHVENSKHKNAVLDRCALDGLVYTRYLYETGNVTKKTLDKAEDIFYELKDKYDIIFYLIPEFDVVDDGVRSTNNEFRNRVFELFEFYISKYDIKVFRLTGTVDERIKNIEDIYASI